MLKVREKDLASQYFSTIYLILHQLRSAENVGAIFRTAEAVGVSKIFLVGLTPRPVDEFSRVNSRLAKSALGAEKLVLWEYVKNFTAVFNKLKKEKIKIVALEQTNTARDYRLAKPNKKLAVVLGNEVAGIPPAVLKKCGQTFFLPMLGQKESLNVSVATGIFLYQIRFGEI